LLLFQTFFIILLMVASGAAAAAAAQQRILQEEEEQMTPYSDSEMHKWEFKIVRCTGFTNFGNPEKFKEVVSDQAKYGWVLLEKFDNYRLRFKRPITEREKDASRPGDPYRSYYGPSLATIVWITLAITFGFIILIMLIVFVSTIPASTNIGTN